MHRRRFLLQGTATCICGLGLPRVLVADQHQDPEGGCAWGNGSSNCDSPPRRLADTMSTSGNRQLDRALIAEVRRIDELFGIRPGYRFFDDRRCPNAWATPNTLVDGTSGTIVFGLTIFAMELRKEFGGAAAAGIAAHEGAHIFQYTHGYNRLLAGPTVRDTELHADFLAGYYFARSGRTERSITVFTQALAAMGTTDFTNPNFHGTGQQRVACMHAGYSVRSADIHEAAQQGVAYVQRI